MLQLLLYQFENKKELRALRANLPPLEQKIESCVSLISWYWFVRKITKVLYPGPYFTFTVAMVTKKGGRIRLKIEKLPFCAKFKAFGDRLFKN